MFMATLSGPVLAFMKENNFLFLIVIFSFYLAFTGYRSVKNKTDNPTLVKWIDVFVAIFTLIFSIWMIVSALVYFNPFKLHLNPVQLVFGAAGLVFSLGDLLWRNRIR
jgi:Mn2+/Fe2+ NRAMP family transporter